MRTSRELSLLLLIVARSPSSTHIQLTRRGMHCPDAWTASEFGCHRIVEAACAQYDCPARCGPDATLACIGSAEENAYIQELAVNAAAAWLWIGNYQRTGSQEPAGGWDVCASGETPMFTSWRDGLPGQENAASYGSKDCIGIGLADAKWFERKCGLLPTAVVNMPMSCGGCLCEYGSSSSPEFLAFAAVQSRKVQDQIADGCLQTGIWAGIGLPLLSLLPLIISWCCACTCRFRRSNRVRSTDYQAEDTNSASTLLAEAELASVLLRTRVSGTIALAGWVICVLGWSAFMMTFLRNGSMQTVAGPFQLYMCAGVLGMPVLLLALRPTDVHRIAISCRIFFVLIILVMCLAIYATTGSVANLFFLLSSMSFAILCGITVLYLAPTVFSRRGFSCTISTMPPRSQLRRMWLAVRCWLLGTAFILLYDLPMQAPCQFADGGQTGFFASGAICLLAGVGFTPTNRGRVYRWLGSLGKTDSKEQEAAAVASLIGGSGSTAATALRLAESSFRAIPVNSLSMEDLVDNKPSPQLHEKTMPVKMGQVGAFVSHSWSDPGALKYHHVQNFAAAYSKEECLIWLDKACIDQTNIDASLACLPIFLSGCNSLLCLAGSTYATRLWCVMELFVFLRMGGRHEEVVVRLLGDADTQRSLFSRFDAGKARCFLAKDRQQLLAVIESGFGTFAPFNKIVRAIFAEKLTGIQQVAPSED